MHLRPLTLAAGAFIAISLCFFIAIHFYHRHPWLYLLQPDDATSRDSILTNEINQNDGKEVEYSVREHITNSTLGFEKIFAIGLPERVDRRDHMTLMTSYQNVSITWVDAVAGESIDKRIWPYNWHQGGQDFSLGALGCWRSHLNTLRKIVEEGHATALIIEDDADWDVDLKEQLVAYANTTRLLGNDLRPEESKLTSSTPTRSPYGDYWDLLWLGSCANTQNPQHALTFPGKGGRRYMVWRERSNGSACTFGYAVTFESAREILALMQAATKPYDLMLGDICAARECIVMWPRLISMHWYAGSSTRDSDINDKEPEIREKGYTPLVENSAMLDALGRFNGERSRERLT